MRNLQLDIHAYLHTNSLIILIMGYGQLDTGYNDGLGMGCLKSFVLV